MKVRLLNGFLVAGLALMSHAILADETQPREAVELSAPKKSIRFKIAAFETMAFLSSWHHLGVGVPENLSPPKKISEFQGPLGRTWDVLLTLEHLAIKKLVADGADRAITTTTGELRYDISLDFEEIKIETKIHIQNGPKQKIFETPVNIILRDIRIPMTLSATDSAEDMDVRPLELRKQDVTVMWPVLPKWVNKGLDAIGFFEAYKEQVHTTLMKELPDALLGTAQNSSHNNR